jgi:soluble lytic murein transglycosylase-like protein
MASVLAGSSAVLAGTAQAGSRELRNAPAGYAPWVSFAAGLCEEINAPLLAAQIEQESGWNDRAVSSIGAEGIAQFLPGTWATYGLDANKNGVNSPFDPADGIVAMGIYMCSLYRLVANVPGDRTRNALWAYNAGPEATRNAGGNPPTAEAENYANRILKELVPKYTP